MYADSVAWFGDLNRMDFVGNVRFRDSTVSLDAQRANYFPGDERIESFGAVRLVNRVTGSTLTGPRLTYWRAGEGLRSESELFSSGRPNVEYHSPSDTAAEPYLIVGQRVRLRGQSLAWAAGNVTIQRSTIDARGDSATLDVDRGEGSLVGHAEASGGPDSSAYRIEGRRIDFRLTDGSITWVQARGLAEAESADWRVLGDTIEFVLANDLIQAGGAWGDSTVPRALSSTQTFEADSLVIDAPDQLLSEVRGYGRAKATSVDSLGARSDWMTGDTVVAQFDSGAVVGRHLARLEARSNARAFYYIHDQMDLSRPPAINYSRGRRITALFKEDGALDRVDVIEAADGVFLEPVGRRQP
jgi:lipopolysaccharide export system protein LptA